MQTHTTRGRRRWLGLVAAIGLALVVAATGCAGMQKSEIEARLVALPKNAGLARLGLQRRSAKVALEGREREVEYVWVHAPADPATRRSRAPIVFVHGTPACLFNWSMLLFDGDAPSELVGAADLYAFDVVGHGIGVKSAAPYTFQACADAVRGFLELLDLRDVTLVGQSYGGEFAWRAALDAPERVSKLVLLDSSGYARGAGEWLPEEEKLRGWPGAGWGYLLNARKRVGPALQHHFADPIRDDQLEEMYLLCDNADNWKAMTQLCRDENGTREREIARIAQPTLLLWGERDVAYTVEKVARRFERDIVNSTLVLAPAGHYPHEETPPFVRRELLSFHLGR